MKKILIIGGGFAGCANAHALSLTGDYEITLVEKGNELGAGVRTYFGVVTHIHLVLDIF